MKEKSVFHIFLYKEDKEDALYYKNREEGTKIRLMLISHGMFGEWDFSSYICKFLNKEKRQLIKSINRSTR